MNKRQALEVFNHIGGTYVGTRQDHESILQAISILKEVVGEEVKEEIELLKSKIT